MIWDSDRRNKLYLPVIDIVRKTMPKWIFFENVCRLFNFKDIDLQGNIKTIPTIIEEEFYKLGYVGKFELVQMADYGLPQTRLRSVGIFRQKKTLIFSKHIHSCHLPFLIIKTKELHYER